MNELTHLDLFSGIGGFALAAQWAGFRTVAFVEREPFCQSVLAARFPGVPIYSDVCTFGGRPFRGVDLLTGGFPCQPFSFAGEQRGKDDDRYLWPEMFRVICATEPRWVIGENVAGLDGLGLDDCISDLESIGYEVAPPLEIPACAVGTFQHRERIWICAHAERAGREGCQSHYGFPSCSREAHAEPGDRVPASWDSLAGHCRGVRDRHGLSVTMVRREVQAYGNAIVPQVAYQIIKAILEIERSR